MYEHLERLFQGLAPISENLKGVYYDIAKISSEAPQMRSHKMNCGNKHKTPPTAPPLKFSCNPNFPTPTFFFTDRTKSITIVRSWQIFKQYI